MAGIASSLGLSRSSTSSSGQRAGVSTLDEQTTQEQVQTGTKLATTTKDSRQQQTSATQTSSEALTNLQSLVENLDVDVQEGIKGLLSSLLQEDGAGDLSGLLTSRAKEADVAFDPSAIVSEARRVGEEAVGQAGQRLAQGAGSSLNTLVQQFTLDEQAQVSSQIAALAQQLGITGRQAATAEITGAKTGITQDATALAGILKGAKQTTTQSQTQQQTATQLVDALTSLFETGQQSELSELVSLLKSEKEARQTIDETASGVSSAKSLSFGISGS